MAYSLSIVGILSIIGFSISSIFIEAPIEPFWNLILTNQLIALSPMIRIKFPILLDKIVKEMKFVNG